jgi:hypothetical protein
MADRASLRIDAWAEGRVGGHVGAWRPNKVSIVGGIRLPQLNWIGIPDPSVQRSRYVQQEEESERDQHNTFARKHHPAHRREDLAGNLVFIIHIGRWDIPVKERGQEEVWQCSSPYLIISKLNIAMRYE